MELFTTSKKGTWATDPCRNVGMRDAGVDGVGEAANPIIVLPGLRQSICKSWALVRMAEIVFMEDRKRYWFSIISFGRLSVRYVDWASSVWSTVDAKVFSTIVWVKPELDSVLGESSKSSFPSFSSSWFSLGAEVLDGLREWTGLNDCFWASLVPEEWYQPQRIFVIWIKWCTLLARWASLFWTWYRCQLLVAEWPIHQVCSPSSSLLHLEV